MVILPYKDKKGKGVPSVRGEWLGEWTHKRLAEKER